MLSQAVLNKLAVAGVPEEVAVFIQGSLNNGIELEPIRRKLAEEFGRDVGYGYLDRFMQAQQKEGGNV